MGIQAQKSRRSGIVMTLTSQVILDDEVRRNGPFVEMSIGLPWFRSLRLSHIVGLTAAADGGEAKPVEILVNDGWLPIESLSQLTEHEWYPQDRQTIRFVEETNQFDLYLAFDLLMPNLFMGPQNPVVIHTSAKQRVSLVD
jgi:hypothetical protein